MEFGRLTDLIDNVLRLNESDILYKVYSDDFIQEEIIELNTTEQLFNRGVDSNNDKLGQYSPNTVAIKAAKGQRFDHVTLNDTGEFYDSWTIKPTLDGFWIDADPVKDSTSFDLFDQWGVDVLGLTDESLKALIPDITAEAIEITLNEILQ